MKKYSRDKFKLHPREGLSMEGLITPFLRFCIGISILAVALGLFALFVTPLVRTLL